MPRATRNAASVRRRRPRATRGRGAKLVAESAAMRHVLERVAQVAAARSALLLEGERGSGRHRMATEIHARSPRAGGPFVHVRCEALPAEGAEDALFGAEDAAGASSLWTSADRGTLFLDEVGALPPPAQARLLLALHDPGFAPRESGARPADVRVVASTARDLSAEVAARRFRGDLRERLGVVRIRVPALRERGADLEPLVAQLLAEMRPEGRRTAGLTRGALERLAAHAWPGNVRELRDTLAAMLAGRRGRGPLSLSDLPESLRPAAALERIEAAVGMTVGEVEQRLVAATLAHTGDDKRRAAALLGIGLRTLYRKIRRYGL